MTDSHEPSSTTPADSPPPPEPDETEPEGKPIDPMRLLRIAGVVREVLEEVRRMKPENDGLQHLQEIHGRITSELRESLPEELFRELDSLTPEIKGGGAEELTLGHAEILGWLQGLFQGTQLAMQMQALPQAPRGLPRGAPPPHHEGASAQGADDYRAGAPYL